MFSSSTGKRLNKYVPDYVLYDLETTGISVKKDKIIEISAVKVRAGKVTEEFSTLVNPGIPIPYYATAVNNITDDMVKNSPTIELALGEFLGFIGNDILVGHNIHNFDMKFIYRETMSIYGKNIDNEYVDTLFLARNCLPQLSNHKLVDLANYYNISTEGAHRALNDCRMNQQVFEKLGKEVVNAIQKSSMILCEKCGSPMKERTGMYGKFLGCTSYPQCKFTRNL